MFGHILEFFANRPSGIELSGFDFSLIDAKFFFKETK